MIFVPMLKTKRGDEKNIIENSLCIFKNNPKIIPYLEIITKEEKRINNFLDKLYNHSFFIEFNDLESYSTYSTPNSINVYRPFLFQKDYNDIPLLIKEKHIYNKRIAFRIKDGEKGMYNSLIKYLDENDYIFIDIGNSEYPTNFINDINNEKRERQCKIIIISDERDKGIRGEDFAYFDYNPSSSLNGLNYSVIDSIKKQTFFFDGFASYCSAKNDTTEGGGGSLVQGVFLIYDYNKNQFFSVQSATKNYVSLVYEDVNKHIESELSKIDTFFINQKISLNILHNYIRHPKNKQAAKFKAISIIHYIETIDYYIYK